MAQPTATFLSYNSTGMNTIKTRWIRDLISSTDSTFVQIQEHFKTTKSTDKFFSDQFPTYSGYVIHGHRDKDQDHGRASGGIAQLSKCNLDVKKTRVKSDSYRFQAQILNFPKINILWINGYFPTDPQLINYDETDLQILLNSVEKVMDGSHYDEVIFGGDFNWDKTRNTGFSSCMERWVNRIGLVDMWDILPVDYTHIHTDWKSLSTLDRFLVSPGLIPLVQDAGVLHFRDGDNPSRHSPIMIRISMDSLPVKKPTQQCAAPRRPAWYKADETQLSQYTSRLSEKLDAIAQPPELECLDPHCHSDQHCQTRDSYMLDVLIAMMETSHETIPMGGGSRRQWDPDKNCMVDSAIPGWRKEVEPLRQDSLFWHAIWQNCGMPNKGQMHERMKNARHKYYALRRCKKLSDSVRAHNLCEVGQH